MRTVIVHYHIFKNAGSTVDHMLENNFKDAWVTFDGAQAHSRIQPQEMENFIRNHPDVVAVSSHNAVLPVPEMPDIAIAPIFFLRHPLDRVRSIYDFERYQGLTAGPISKGAEHAAKLNFDDYIQWRFNFTKNGVTHNFHTMWLLHSPRFQRFEIKPQDYEQAIATLRVLPFFGLVERFDDSLQLMSTYLKGLGIEIAQDYQVKNTSKHITKSLEDRLLMLRQSIGDQTWALIESGNQWDMKLYDEAQKLFQARFENLTTS